MRALFGAATLALVGMLGSCTQYPELGSVQAVPEAGPPAAEATPAPQRTAAVYRPPARSTAAAPAVTFPATRSQVVRSIRNEARAEGLEVTQRDNSRGLVVVRYEGPAAQYVDCGSYSIPGSAFSAPAVAGSLVRSATSTEGATEVNQDTQLNTRLVARVNRRDDTAADAQVEAQYVLRRDLIYMDAAGDEVRRTREFVDFLTEGQGRFSDGTTCVATGVLERSVLPEGGVGIGA